MAVHPYKHKLGGRLTVTALIKCVGAIVFVGALSGCIVAPVPHATRASPHVEGKIVDSVTHAPVDRALVQLSDRPRVAANSGADGLFILPHAWNFHLLWWATYDGIDAHWPFGQVPSGAIRVSHTNYVTSEFKIQDLQTAPISNRWPWCSEPFKILEDIPLDPRIK
jgi:hypothetical protein